MKIKCSYCGSNAQEVSFNYKSAKKNPQTGESIVVKAKCYKCDSHECGVDWLSQSQEEFIDDAVSRVLRKSLLPEEIALIRKSLPFSTKKALADFLCLNAKAFVKWENGYSEPNMANDLLLRLLAYSKDNHEFIKELHKKNFTFNSKDYFYVREHLKNKIDPIIEVYQNKLAQPEELSSVKANYVDTTNAVAKYKVEEEPLAA